MPVGERFGSIRSGRDGALIERFGTSVSETRSIISAYGGMEWNGHGDGWVGQYGGDSVRLRSGV